MPGPSWAEVTLLGQAMTEAQGGVTGLRPPCEKGERPLRLAPQLQASSPGKQPASLRGGSCAGVALLQGS